MLHSEPPHSQLTPRHNPQQPQPQASPHSQPPPQPQSQPQPQSKPHQHKHQHMTKSWLNPSFILANLMIFGFSFAFIYLFLGIRRPSFWIVALVIYAVLFVMTQWSYWMTVCTNPGKVPIFYGLSPQIGPDTRRIYCSLCHNFKPDRTHHCSTCKQCVLNMDHHCPWVNNCIGFLNRKYFLLFLIYISAGLVFATIIEIIVVIGEIRRVAEMKQVDACFVLRLVLLLVTIGLSFALVVFMHFHVKMVLDNTTTLEGMIRKKNTPESQEIDNYDVGNRENLKQVFGESPFYWALPIKGDGPKGNGTLWPKPDDLRTNTGKDTELAPLKHLGPRPNPQTYQY